MELGMTTWFFALIFAEMVPVKLRYFSPEYYLLRLVVTLYYFELNVQSLILGSLK
jgi:hypothetical protein